MVLQGVAMGVWVLNLLHHTDGLKTDLLLKLFPLTVKYGCDYVFLFYWPKERVVFMSVSLVTALNQALWCLVLWWAVFWLKFAAMWVRLVYVLKSLKASDSVLPLLQRNAVSRTAHLELSSANRRLARARSPLSGREDWFPLGR